MDFSTSLQSPLSRQKYLLYGIALALLKHNIDRVVASVVFHRDFGVFNYWKPSANFAILSLPRSEWAFYATLFVLCIPFVLIGLFFTLRRLRDAGLATPWCLLFFVPVINILFFAVLCIVPTKQTHDVSISDGWIARMVPRSAKGAAASGALLTAVLGAAVAIIGVDFFTNYGWGLFIGLPFAIGLVSTTIFNFHERHSLSASIGVSMLSITLSGLIVFGLAFEGVICLAMAAPIAALLATIGAILGHVLRINSSQQAESAGLIGCLILGMPGLMAWETASHPAPEAVAVRTVIEINASPEVVWKNVVSFSELPPAEEWYFKAGVAYPIHATITGTGVGAVRHCVFSTGAFVEPITDWDAPHRLAFSVTAQPPAMREFSYTQVNPVHLTDSYLQSKRGEFLLEALPGGRTRLTGTTWYTLKFWPVAYWQIWSDALIHRIHLRVLHHIRQLSETKNASPLTPLPVQ